MPITGKVKWFDPGRGYGFIARDDGEGDVFVHQSAIPGEGYQSLNEDDRVEFDVVQGEKGPRAENVRKLADDATAEEPAAETDEAAVDEASEEPVAEVAEEETTEETEAEAEEAPEEEAEEAPEAEIEDVPEVEAEAETDVEAEADVEADGDEDPGVGDRAPADVDPKGDP